MTALDGKVILLTGATDGMGRALAADLGREGATVLVHGRDQARIAATVAEVAGAAGNRGLVRSYRADLASLAAVRALAAAFPPGTAKYVPAGSELMFELHYTPIGRMKVDRSSVASRPSGSTRDRLDARPPPVMWE